MANRNMLHRFHHWRLRSSRAVCGSRVKRVCLNAPTSVRHCKIVQVHLFVPLHRTVQAQPLACLDICSGLLNVKVRAQFAQHHQMHVKVELAWVLPHIRYLFQCRRSDSNEFDTINSKIIPARKTLAGIIFILTTEREITCQKSSTGVCFLPRALIAP